MRERPVFAGEINRPATSDNAPYVVLEVRFSPCFWHFVWDRLLACLQHGYPNETLGEFRYECMTKLLTSSATSG